MFNFVREKRRLVQIVLALIVLPFALWGVDSYRHGGDTASIAKVNGEKISQQEFDSALEQQRQRMREMAGANFDPALFDKPEVKQSVLDGLVAQYLLQQAAHKAGLVVSDEQMARLIASVPAFQQEGKFDKSRYEAALRAQGMTPALFEYRVRQDLTARQLTDAYAQNGFAAQSVAATLIRLNEQARVVSLAKWQTQAVPVTVTEAEVQQYYAQHPQEFQVPERARIEYVTFSVDGLMEQVEADEREIKAYYEEHLNEFGTPEQRQAAHILIALPKQAGDAEKAAAKAKAETVLQQVRKTPAKFAELAKQYSQDPGSAARGGDLGFFGRGMMVKPFEEAVFALKPGEISGLVQSDFGYHIIRLTAVKAARTQPLEEVKALISQRIKFQKASDEFAELSEKFSNIVYEQSDTLKPAAELVHAPLQTGVWLSRDRTTSAQWGDKVVQAVFSEDVLKNGRNTNPIEIAPNTLMAARVLEYQAASSRPLAEVAGAIRANLQRQHAMQATAQQGKALLARLQAGDKVPVTWQKAETVSRMQTGKLSRNLVQAVLRANVSKLPAYVGLEEGETGYVLARIEAVKEAAPPDAAKLERYTQQIRQITGEELLTAYLTELKREADISMKPFTVSEK
ncbi:MAG: SurA N-terminal domain-containing protein [Sideroxydans sp.]